MFPNVTVFSEVNPLPAPLWGIPFKVWPCRHCDLSGMVLL